MKRLSGILWALAIVVAACMLYTVKYQVQSLKAQIAQTSRELESEKEALHVVAAEWAYLNRPERLNQLAAKYLKDGEEVTVGQVADIQAIPFPSQTVASIEGDESIRPVSARSLRPGGAQR